ncbi:pectinesterase family protein [Fontivita pretiosa]|uniref:pectinesterase family protein n=1 Tax=Fontivita pretiosa TaxID=2989684 RepID=UPI003D164733
MAWGWLGTIRIKAAGMVVLAVAQAACLGDVQMTVDKSGGGQFTTVQAAINAVPANSPVRYVINIAPGRYSEQIRVDKPNITLRGTGGSASATVLTYHETAQPGNRLANASAAVQARDFIAENLTFENSAGDNRGAALAMYVDADRAVFNNVRFLSWQDTLRPEKGRHYFFNCYIEGDVDFIYGKGQAYFENCTLYAKAGGYITAQGRESATETNGFVFHHATVGGSAPNGSVYLGRPWQPYARVIFLESYLGPVIHPSGWATWSGDNHLTSYFAEYANTGPGAAGQRPAWTYRLTASEIGAFSMSSWLAGSDNWNPAALVPEPGLALPVSALSILMFCRRSHAPWTITR